MATLRTTLPDLYLSRLAFLEDVLFDEMPIEAGVWDVQMALAPSLFPSPLPPEGVPRS